MNDQNLQIISYLTLRKLIGAIGILLPIVLMIGDFVFSNSFHIQSSISNYYSTPMRNILVGVLFVLGFFLLSYKGYEPIDNITGTLGFFFALGVALFPCTHSLAVVRTIHFASAALLFIVFVIFSLFLFTKTNKQVKSVGKKQRNLVFIICGLVIIVVLPVIAFVFIFLPKEQIASSTLIFWLESIALWAFGVSWLVKGRFLS